jgi:hypothetical protein
MKKSGKKYLFERKRNLRNDQKLTGTLGQFEEAMRKRDLQAIIWMIDSGSIDVNHESFGGETALFAAIAVNDVAAIELLLTR